MSSAEEKIGECVVCCHRCGGFLMESASTTSYMVCPECGVRLVVCVKKGKVSVFDDNRSEEELAKKRHARLTGYAAKLNKLGKQQLDLQLNIYEDAREIAGLVAGMALKGLQMSDVWNPRVCEESRIYYGQMQQGRKTSIQIKKGLQNRS